MFFDSIRHDLIYKMDQFFALDIFALLFVV